MIDQWISNIVTASLYGGLVLLLLIAIRGLWQMPAWFECLSIRLACVKLLVAALIPIAIGIPLLPSYDQEAPSRATVSIEREAGSPVQKRAGHGPIEREDSRISDDLQASGRPNERQTESSDALASPPFIPAPSMPVADKALPTEASSLSKAQMRELFIRSLFVLWVLGVAFQAARFFKNWIDVRHLHASAKALMHSELVDYSYQVSRNLGLRRPPRLMSYQGGGSPRLVGSRQPAILLPSEFIEHCTVEEAKLIIGHELAHVVRKDLFWNWIVTLTQAIFFFHPLVWLAVRRMHASQEMACDHLVLSRLRARVGDYAKLLLKVMLMQQEMGNERFAEIGASGRAGTLEERLLAMKNYSMKAPRRSLITFLVAVALVVVLLPWKVVAQRATSDDTNSRETSVSRSVQSTGQKGTASGEQRQGIVSRSFATGRSNENSSARVSSSPTSGRVSGIVSRQDETRPNQERNRSRSTGSNGASASSSSSSSGGRSASGFSSSGDGTSSRGSSSESSSSSSSSDGVSNFTFTENGKTLKIRQSEDRIEVTRTIEVDGESRTQKQVFRTPEEFQEKWPAEYERFRTMSRGTAGGRVSAFGFDDGGVRDADSGELNRAEQMLLEQLLKMKEESADNPQMSALIQQMIDDVKKGDDSK